MLKSDHTNAILDILERHPEGMKIKDLARALGCHRNSVAGRLNAMQLDGRVDLHYRGREKVFVRSYRTPYNALRHIDSQCIVGLDKNLDIADANGPFLMLLGLPSKEPVLSHSITSVPFSPFHDPEAVRSIKAGLAGKESSRTIEVYVGSEVRPYKMKCIPTIFDNKRIGVALLIYEDPRDKGPDELASYRKNCDRALSEDQEEFVVRFYPDGTISFINDAYCRALGLPFDEVVGRKFGPIIPGDDRELLKKHFATLTEDHPVETIEHKCVLRDGSVRWHRWRDRAIFKEGRIAEYRSVGSDITAYKHREESLVKLLGDLNRRIEEKNEEWRKINRELVSEILERERVQAELKESESRYRAIVESQPEMIFRWKPDGTLTFVNNAGCSYVGMPREAVLGINFLDFLVKNDRQRLKNYVTSASPPNSNTVVKLKICIEKEKVLWQEWSVEAIFDPEGKPAEFQSVGRVIAGPAGTEANNLELEGQYESAGGP